MKKILIQMGVGASLLGALFIPVAVTHASYYMGNYNYGNNMPYMQNYSYNSNRYNNVPNYSYNYNYNSSYPTYSYSNGYNDSYYNTSSYNTNYNGNYYNQYPQYNYAPTYYAPQTQSYTVTHICGPNSTYNPAGDDCDCWSGYVSQNNICVAQQVVYNYNPGYYNAYGLLKPVAICNDGSTSYSPVGTCWLNGGVRTWTS